VKKISVIIPIYNVEKYLDECIESVVKQTYGNLEIILVDDGSTDKSGAICDKWQEIDERISVIHKENGGLSDARNVGMTIATGEYIAFLDSDDRISPVMYENLVKEMEKKNCHIAITGLTSDIEALDLNHTTDDEAVLYQGRELANITFFQEDKKMTYQICKCIFDKNSLQGLLFPIGKYYEDVCFYMNALWNTTNVVYLDKNYYYYRIREGSITHIKLTDKHIDDLLLYSKNMLEFYKYKGTTQEMKKACSAVLKDILAYRWLCKKQGGLIEAISKIDKFMKENNLRLLQINGGVIELMRYTRYSL